jgi:hypothetical protein
VENVAAGEREARPVATLGTFVAIALRSKLLATSDSARKTAENDGALVNAARNSVRIDILFNFI